MSTARDAIINKLNEDFGIEPDANRGVPLKDPVMLEPEKAKPEAQEEPVEEVNAEGQEQPEEVSEEVEETAEEIHAEGQKLRAKDFADQAGWSLEEFYRDVTVPTDEGEVTLSEVVDGYKSLRQENESLRQERQELEAKATQAPQPMQQYAPEAVELIKEVDILQRQYDAIQQDGTLDNMDAGEALKLERKYRYEIERRQRAAQEKQREHMGKLDAEAKEYMAEVEKQIRSNIPEWRSQKVRSEETEAISAYLSSEGAEQQTIDQVLKFNPWAARMFRRLWQYEKSQKATQKAVKKVERIPRSLQPGPGHQTPKKPSLRDVGKQLDSAKSRRQWSDTLLNADFDDSLLPK